MKTDSIDFCVRISLAHASLKCKLDDELGTFTGAIRELSPDALRGIEAALFKVCCTEALVV